MLSKNNGLYDLLCGNSKNASILTRICSTSFSEYMVSIWIYGLLKLSGHLLNYKYIFFDINRYCKELAVEITY